MEAEQRDGNSSEEGSDKEKKEKAESQIALTNRHIHSVELTIQVLTVISGALALFGGVLSLINGHRDAASWTFCAAAVVGIISSFCWLQDRAWKQDQAERVAAPPVANPVTAADHYPIHKHIESATKEITDLIKQSIAVAQQPAAPGNSVEVGYPG